MLNWTINLPAANRGDDFSHTLDQSLWGCLLDVLDVCSKLIYLYL